MIVISVSKRVIFRGSAHYKTIRDKCNSRGIAPGTDGVTNHLYMIGNQQDPEVVPHVVMGMLQVLTFDYYALPDLGMTLSLMTLYVTSRFVILLEFLLEPFFVFTPIGESILANIVYGDCVVSIHHRKTLTNLIKLEMIDFKVILGMDCFHACYASISCRTQNVKFQFSNKLILE